MMLVIIQAPVVRLLDVGGFGVGGLQAGRLAGYRARGTALLCFAPFVANVDP